MRFEAVTSGRFRSSAVQTAACSCSQRTRARSAAMNEHQAYSPTVTKALSNAVGAPRSSKVSRSARSAMPTLRRQTASSAPTDPKCAGTRRP